ncbi:MAG: type II toxin-antitoxin system RelE/ParE family toxin [Pseudomonadota bacterium]
MPYKLVFKQEALDEWERLDGSIKKQFKKVLEKRLENPHVESAKLHSMQNAYKIKLKTIGYRLVYIVEDEAIKIIVIAVGRRDKSEVYVNALRRLHQE